MRRLLIDDWRRLAPRLWTVQIAAFWGGVCGLAAVWPAFQAVVPLWAFALVGIGVAILIAIARVTKQPGLDQ
jgi:hypothetical protein